jgi:hypothetical protein
VPTLDGVGHGTLLAGRYRLEERVRTGTDSDQWRAVDTTLERQVSIQVIRAGHPFTADVVDAARRAALVGDPRLVRVLDVGVFLQSAYIVSEHLIGRTLEEILVAGPIPAETARGFVGEAAEALERASSRGLHHLRLSPASLVIASNGSVKVLGTAVEAALAGTEQDDDPLGADRLDALGLVRILYAGLTGRWPGPVDGPLGPAPRVTGRAVPPAELVAGVPHDLDALCSTALSRQEGPQSPGELAQELAPWAPDEPLTDPRGLALDGPHRPPSAEDRPDDAGGQEWRSVLEEAPGDAGSFAARSGDTASYDSAWPYGDREPYDDSAVSAAFTGRSAQDDRISMGSGASAHSGSSALHPGTSSGGLTTGGRRVSRFDGLDDWALLAQSAPAPSQPPESQPLGPFLPPAPVSRPPQDQARFVLILVAGLVTVGLILAAFSLRGLFDMADPMIDPIPTAPTATAGGEGASSAEAAPVPASPQSASPSTTPTPSGTPAQVSGIQAIDPEGDGDENGSTADKAIDGDPSTTWRSARYSTASFGGLKKGLGLYLMISGKTVTSITVSAAGTGGAVELRTAKGPGLDSSAVVATGKISNGSVVLTPAQPVTSESLLLWFTELPQQSNREHRLVVSEITAS